MSTISSSTTSTTAYKVTADTTGTLVIQTGATPTTAVTVDASQNVGVGQTSQVWDEKLGVRLATSGSGTVGLGVYSASTTYASSMIRVQAETGGSGWKMYEGRANGGSQLFWVDGSGGAYFAGNVGIGTSSPGYKFEVTGGDVRTNTSAFLYANTLRLRGSDTYQIYESAASTNLQVGTASGAIIFAPSLTERMRLDTSGNLQFNSGYGSAATAYGCRAWVNFNGTTSPGTIRGSGNVTSVTKISTGQYTVNFTSSMPDVNYCVLTTIDSSRYTWADTRTVSSVNVYAFGAAYADPTSQYVAIFR